MVVRKKIFFSARFQKKNRRSISLSLAFDRLLLVCWDSTTSRHAFSPAWHRSVSKHCAIINERIRVHALSKFMQRKWVVFKTLGCMSMF